MKTRKQGNKETKKRVHFVGIGGIGISALAQWYLSEGYRVSGTDISRSEIINVLEKMGVGIIIRNPKSEIRNPKQVSNFKSQIQNYIQDTNFVVYSTAVPEDDWELRYAKKLGKKVLSYPEALGELTRKYKTICVSGTHGKSTTTAMLALIMIKAGLDPTVILGTKLREFAVSGIRRLPYPGYGRVNKVEFHSFSGNNFRKGKSGWLLIEADEHRAAFLNYSPYMIILTNIDKEHLDYYKDMKHILGVYLEYIKGLPKGGVLVFNGDDRNIKKVVRKIKTERIFDPFG